MEEKENIILDNAFYIDLRLTRAQDDVKELMEKPLSPARVICLLSDIEGCLYKCAKLARWITEEEEKRARGKRGQDDGE